MKVKKVWMDLDRCGFDISNTLEFLLSPTRDAEAAKRFFLKALARPHAITPGVINVDKNATYPKAISELKAEGATAEGCERRQVKYLNNIVEQDHHFIKGRVKAGLGCFSVESAWRTLQGYEVMNMVRNGQMRGVEIGGITGQVAFVSACLE